MKQYKLYVVLLLIFPTILPCKSEKYVIVKMVPATEVRIGNQICGIGSEIDVRDTIFWNNADTLIMNVLCNDKNCYAPRLTIYYPQDMVSDDEFMNLHHFLFTETKPLVGYGALLNDTIYVYPNSYSSIHIFQKKEDCLYAHIANSNVTFELTPIDKQYFISSNDFKNQEAPIELEIYNSPYLKGENKVKTIIVIFENF